MSKLDDLIDELCPNGVEYIVLGELGKFYGGLTGKSKDDFTDGNAAFITYKNVYSNPALDIDPEDTVKIGEDENQRTLEYGDVVFTGSSETPNECGFSAVVTKIPEKALYLNSFCFFFRFYDISGVEPDFLKHLFRSHSLRRQIGKTANGVTRFNVSKEKMAKIQIPLPPLPVQSEIVRILDNFTELTAELTAELTDRKKQYEYYKKSLLTFEGEFELKQLGEICSVQAGGTPSKNEIDYWQNGTIKWLGSTVCKNQKTVDEITNYITELGLKKSSARLMQKDSTLIALVGATIGKVAFLPFEATINQNIAGVYPLDDKKVLPSYIYYACTMLYSKFLDLGKGKLAMANLSFVRSLEIPIPYPNDTDKSLLEQQRIVDILDRFDTLCNDISKGLPSEIDERQKQYEYYRDKLLTFEKLDVEV
ncbi:MAG: hypothetical protein BKP49_06940 [Treponema sp. CETP13]|nr:MAG: hypothetical protein BKP49_06940 [Treponema sp. CETP13]